MLEFIVKRPIAVLMIVTAMIIFGLIARSRLTIELMPPISYPTITVRSEYPGADPMQVEQDITSNIEEILATTSGLTQISSISGSGISEVILQFSWKKEMNSAIQDVREKLGLLFLPDGAKKPLVLRYDPSLDPVMRLALTGNMDLYKLKKLAEYEIKPQILSIPGVAAVRVLGGIEKELRIELDTARLASSGLKIQAITSRLSSEDINLSGGIITEEGIEYVVRTTGRLKKVEQFGEIVFMLGSSNRVKLKDFAKINLVEPDEKTITRINGSPGIQLAIYREADASIVAMAKAVKDKVFGTKKQKSFVKNQELKSQELKNKKDLKKKQNKSKKRIIKDNTDFITYNLPVNTNIKILSDYSLFIKSAVSEVTNAALIGGLLAIIILQLFLRNGHATIAIGLSIPLSLIFTFVPMFLTGISLNIMSLGGLALGVGMLVDNSIVVLESIQRLYENGYSKFKAAILGTKEVVIAVITSTLTTIAVFAPILFVEGVAGQIFRDFALTVVCSLLASLVISITVVPTFIAFKKPPGSKNIKNNKTIINIIKNEIWLKLKSKNLFFIPYYFIIAFIETILRLIGSILEFIISNSIRALLILFKFLKITINLILTPFIAVINFLMKKLQHHYPNLLNHWLYHPTLIMLITIILFIWSLYGFGNLGSELIPRLHWGKYNIELEFAPGTDLDSMSKSSKKIESLITKVTEVETVITTIGKQDEWASNSESGKQKTILSIILKESRSPDITEFNSIKSINEILNSQPGFKTTINYPVLFTLEYPIELQIVGEDLNNLYLYGKEIERKLKQIKGIRDAKSYLKMGNPEVVLSYQREKLINLGLSSRDLAIAVRDLLGGKVVKQVYLKGERGGLDLRVRGDKTSTATIHSLAAVKIPLNNGKTIPLDSVTNWKFTKGPVDILRINSQRANKITADISGFNLGYLANIIQNKIANKQPEGLSINLSGQNLEMKNSLQSLKFALFLAIFLVYIVMASSFESLIMPLIVMFTIPLAIIGITAILSFQNIPVSIPVLIGAIVLAGIVVNNAIVLLSSALKFEKQGLNYRDSIIKAATVRIRPVLMTAITTLLGLMPMVILGGEGSEIRQPLGLTMIGGLITSTILTLFIIPIMYLTASRFRTKI